MKTDPKRTGFSLLEVNMAIFVMAIGVLSIVMLYPLGLRESTQGAADLKQAMFADYILNQAVALASQTNITWSEWSGAPRVQGATISDLSGKVPGFIKNKLDTSGYPKMRRDVHFKIGCCLVPGASERIMGIMVQSTDQVKTVTDFNQVTNNPIYYAEALFQGIP
jgi:hypothetical protein